MVSVKVASVAGAVALFASLANAADMPGLPPVYMPQVEEFASASGWYLRGDIGMTNQQFKGLHQRLYDVPGTTVEAVGMGWDSSMFLGIGVGYKFNDWLRADLTGEYRGKANFHGSDSTSFNLGGGARGVGVDNYSGSKSEWLFLANAYVDLGTWWCLTPYVGLGVGGAKVKISGFRDDGIAYVPDLAASTVYAADATKMNFAWAVHAGITYKVTQAMSIDLGYRYIDMGSGTTGATRAFDNSFTNGGPFTFKNITSHDLKLGVRWML
jgi:opacity protein-like surface antigen